MKMGHPTCKGLPNRGPELPGKVRAQVGGGEGSEGAGKGEAFGGRAERGQGRGSLWGGERAVRRQGWERPLGRKCAQ